VVPLPEDPLALPFWIDGLMSSAQLASVSEVEPVACWCINAFITACKRWGVLMSLLLTEEALR